MDLTSKCLYQFHTRSSGPDVLQLAPPVKHRGSSSDAWGPPAGKESKTPHVLTLGQPGTSARPDSVFRCVCSSVLQVEVQTNSEAHGAKEQVKTPGSEELEHRLQPWCCSPAKSRPLQTSCRRAGWSPRVEKLLSPVK